MNVLQNMMELYNHLAPDSTYRYAINGIFMHLQEVSNSSIYDAVELTNTSRTTIWRMLQMLGYENYSEFRVALKQAVNNYTYYNRLTGEKESDDSKIVARLCNQADISAALIRNSLHAVELRQMAQRVSIKKHIYFFFPYRSPSIYSFQQNLAMAGIRTDMYCLLSDMMKCLSDAEDNGLAFCSTIESTETLDMTQLFRAFKEKGVEVALFTPGRTRYEKYVDYQICRFDDSHGILPGMILYDMYLYALSDIFRNNYLQEE